MKHSGFGIWSFALSLLVGISMFVLIAAAGVIEAATPGGMDEESPAAVVIGLGFFALAGVGLIALGLGVANFFQADRKKVFGILGVVFSAGILLVAVGVLILGLMVG